MVTSRVHFRGMVYAICYGLLWLLQRLLISLQQIEGFWGVIDSALYHHHTQHADVSATSARFTLTE